MGRENKEKTRDVRVSNENHATFLKAVSGRLLGKSLKEHFVQERNASPFNWTAFRRP